MFFFYEQNVFQEDFPELDVYFQRILRRILGSLCMYNETDFLRCLDLNNLQSGFEGDICAKYFFYYLFK